MFENLQQVDGLTAMIVDDDAEIRALYRALLERDGWKVVEAANGAIAIETARSQPPDVFIMDVVMPGMDGYEATRTIRADPMTANTPVVMLSACVEPDAVIKGLDCGADEYLSKPIHPKEFVLRMRAMSRLRRASRELERSYERLGEQSWALNCLLDFSTALSRAETLEAVFDRMLELAVTMTACRRVLIAVSIDNGDLDIVRASRREDMMAIPIARVGTICGDAMAAGKTLLLEDEDAAGQWAGRADFEFLCQTPSVAVPIKSRDQSVGIICAGGRVGSRPFSPQDLEYLELAASYAASAIHMIQTGKARDAARDAIVVGLAQLAEHRDNDTGTHLERVANFCVEIADALRGEAPYNRVIDEDFLHNIQRAAPLHDIGKVATPDAILLKPGRLTDEERNIMQMHTVVGAETIRSLMVHAPDSAFLRMAEDITHAHHEWYDGTGYPRKLKGEQIPLAARIAAIADVYDALRTERIYKRPMSHDEAVRHILEASGTQFDPIVVEAFLRKQKAIERLATHLSNQKPAAKRIRAVQAVSATMNVEQTPATTISPAVTEPARRD